MFLLPIYVVVFAVYVVVVNEQTNAVIILTILIKENFIEYIVPIYVVFYVVVINAYAFVVVVDDV